MRSLLVPASLTLTLLCAPEAARACTQSPLVDLTAVATANATGPLVFLARCRESGSIECQATIDSGLAVTVGAVAVPGSTRELKTLPDGGRLLAFTPSGPLSAGGTYKVIFNSSADGSYSSFERASAGSAQPLAALTAEESWLTETWGPRYSCDTPQSSAGLCAGSSGGISWFLETRLSALLSVDVRPSDGWLFRGGGGEPSQGAEPIWTNGITVSTLLPDEDEHCLTLEAWHVLDDTHQTRTLCGRASPKSEDERRQVIESPNLGSCEEAPVHADTGLEVPELLTTWCGDRKAYCAGQQANSQQPYVCPQLDERCADIAPAAGSTADSGVSDRSESDSTDEPADSSEGGCQLGANPARGRLMQLVLGALGLLVGRRRRGSRSPTTSG